MIETIITSKTRIQLLLRFFMNPERQAYLRELAAELGESSNGVRVELDRLEKAKLLEAVPKGRIKAYKANPEHPLFADIQSIVKKTLGIDKLIEEILNKLGDVRLALITGDYAKGIDSGIIDLVLVGTIQEEYLAVLVRKAESKIGKRKIRTLVMSQQEYEHYYQTLKDKAILQIYQRD